MVKGHGSDFSCKRNTCICRPLACTSQQTYTHRHIQTEELGLGLEREGMGADEGACTCLKHLAGATRCLPFSLGKRCIRWYCRSEAPACRPLLRVLAVGIATDILRGLCVTSLSHLNSFPALPAYSKLQ